MNVQIRNGYEDQIFLPDLLIIVDVFRASTTAVAILEKRPKEFLITNSLDVLQKLANQSYRVVSEVFDLGIDNSPSLVRSKLSEGEKVVQKTTNLTTAIEANYFDGTCIIGCFNNLDAIVHFVDSGNYKNVEILPCGQMEKRHATKEDTHCAELILERLTANIFKEPDIELLLGNFEEKKKTRNWPSHYIEDLEIAVRLNQSKEVPQVVRKDIGIFEVRSAMLTSS